MAQFLFFLTLKGGGSSSKSKIMKLFGKSHDDGTPSAGSVLLNFVILH